MDGLRRSKRKRKATQYFIMDVESLTPAIKTHVSDSARTAITCPTAPVRQSRSGSDASCQTHLICGELLDLMTLDSTLDCTPSTSDSSASLLSVTTAGTPSRGFAPSGNFHAQDGCSSASDKSASSAGCASCCCSEAAAPQVASFGVPLFDLPEECLVVTMAAMYGLSTQCAQVGSSYFRRVAARDPCLRAAAAAHPDFAPLVEGVPADAQPLAAPLAAELRSLTNANQWLMALHLACTYLAAKNIDKVRYKSLLTMILSHAHGAEVPARVGAGLEVELLLALRWRLGPFFHSAPSCCCCPPAAAVARPATPAPGLANTTSQQQRLRAA